MSKFKVGDKVVFNREKAKSDIDRLSPGADSWLGNVPKGPLTINEAVGIDTVRVEECPFLFSSDWLDKYEEPVRVEKFKVGDKVYVRRDAYTGVSPKYIDYDRAYTITRKWTNGALVLDGELSSFGFSEDWLVKADEVKKTDKMEVKISEGRIKDVKFSGPATIVFWTDGTKTVVKCRKGDNFDPEKGIAMACAKKLLGNEDGYHKEIAKYTKTEKNDESALMDTEELRSFVRKTCNSFIGCTDCPCRVSKGGKCFIIADANREQLSMMYRQFLYSGKLGKEESNA